MSKVQDLTSSDVADIFGTSGQPDIKTAPNFGGGLDLTGDLFDSPPAPPIIPTQQQPDPKIPDQSQTQQDDNKDDNKDPQDADLFSDKEPQEGDQGDKTLEITGLSEYYQDRLKNGQFVGIEEEDENGKKTQFIPKTPEEFDEILQIQIDYKVEEAKKSLEQTWYEGKSPAWKIVSQYAEMVDDPTQMIPFLQGVNNIQSVSALNEEDPEQAEEIVRIRMEQRGDPTTIIKSQIDALKSTDSLVTTAKQVKPLMIQQEQRSLAQQVQEAKAREQEYLKVISDIRENAHKAIEQPIFGKNKLKQNEKALIYDMIAVPSEQTQGYGIYTAIDKLFDSKDFETLKMISLLIGDKKAFFDYLGSDIANQTATQLRKKLVVAGEMRGGSKEPSIQDKPVVQRNQFNKTPKFGSWTE